MEESSWKLVDYQISSDMDIQKQTNKNEKTEWTVEFLRKNKIVEPTD